MIITCPACSTRYDVPESAIGAEGREVRCASCGNSWLQEPAEGLVEAALEDPPEAPPPAAPEPETEPVPPPLADPPDAPPAIGEPSPQLPIDDVVDPKQAYYEGSGSPFEYEPPFAARRARTRLWIVGAVLFVVLAIGIAAAAFAWYGTPDWLPLARSTFTRTQPGLVLDFKPDRMDRRTLSDGTEYFGASGTITNVDVQRRTIPPILIVLRDQNRNIVYRWEVVPPRRQLGPGESMTINEAVTDVPRSAKFPEVGWKPT